MKKGDIVTIEDGSYTRSVIDGKLVEEFLACGDEKGKQYVVIETDCKFPAVNGTQARDFSHCSASFNNMVIQAIDSGKVVFIEERFLKLVEQTHIVMVDLIQITYSSIGGETVEISDELYREILRQR